MDDRNPHSLQSEASPATVSAISRILARDFRRAMNKDDLRRRLALKGYKIRRGFLMTAPQGKRICPLDRLRLHTI